MGEAAVDERESLSGLSAIGADDPQVAARPHCEIQEHRAARGRLQQDPAAVGALEHLGVGEVVDPECINLARGVPVDLADLGSARLRSGASSAAAR